MALFNLRFLSQITQPQVCWLLSRYLISILNGQLARNGTKLEVNKGLQCSPFEGTEFTCNVSGKARRCKMMGCPPQACHKLRE
jgi:hypothetical protein